MYLVNRVLTLEARAVIVVTSIRVRKKWQVNSILRLSYLHIRTFSRVKCPQRQVSDTTALSVLEDMTHSFR